MSTPTLQEARTPSTLKPAATSFDFLSGDYQRVQNARLAVIGLVGLTAILLLLMVGYGVLTRANIAEQSTNLDQAKSELLSAESAYGAASNVGASSRQVQDDLDARGAGSKLAASTEVDLGTLLSDLQVIAPGGVEVTGLTVAAAEGTEPTSAPEEFTITITATATSYQDVAAWKSALRSISYLDLDGEPLNAGDPATGVTVTATASVAAADLPSPHLTTIEPLTQVSAGGSK